MFAEVERLITVGQQLIEESKWHDAIEVLKQAEEALPSSSLDTAVCFLREKVGCLLGQAYDRAGQLAGAINASKMVHVECLKSRALLLLKANYPNEAALILKELATLDKSWVDLVQAAQPKNVTPPVTLLLDLGPAALDLVLLQMERWGLFRDKSVSTKLFRTCRAMKDLAAKFIDFRVTLMEGRDISFDGVLQCGSLTIRAIAHSNLVVPPFPFDRVRLRHLTLRSINFPVKSEILHIKGLSSLRLELCKNVRIDLTGVEDLAVHNCEFQQVTGSLKALRLLSLSYCSESDLLLHHIQAQKPKITRLEVQKVPLSFIQNWLRHVRTLGIRIDDWARMKPLIVNAEYWQYVKEVRVWMDVVNLELWSILMRNLINCRGLIVEGRFYHGMPLELPFIWPPNLAYLKLSGMIKVAKAEGVMSKKGVAKGHFPQPKCLHIRGDEVFGLKLNPHVTHLILENFTRKRHTYNPKDSPKLQVIVIGNKGLTAENRLVFPPEIVTSGLLIEQSQDDLFKWDRELYNLPPWGLRRRK